jgi:hypothetical protein
MREQLVDWFLDYMNNFCTVAGFADHYGISEKQAIKLLELGRELHKENEVKLTPAC